MVRRTASLFEQLPMAFKSENLLLVDEKVDMSEIRLP
jgi:hypothetical protein